MGKAKQKEEANRRPPVLAFERKLCPSDGTLYYGKWDNNWDNLKSQKWEPLPVLRKTVRGTKSQFQEKWEEDPLKLSQEIAESNPQTVDYCCLPENSDAIKCCFSLKILSDVGVPCACGDPAYMKKLMIKIKEFNEKITFKNLALRYSQNLVNARYLWRNRLSADKIRVSISFKNGEFLNFEGIESKPIDIINDVSDENIKKIASYIENAFAGSSENFLSITAYALLGSGQEVFPSQELVMKEKGKSKEGSISKVLFRLNGEQAGLHSQKIGNAIRSIDTWYPGSEGVRPIAVEPYGAVTNLGEAYRSPKTKKDFYTLIDEWVIGNKELEQDDQNYIIANLIRGGVFGGGKSEKGKKEDASDDSQAELDANSDD